MSESDSPGYHLEFLKSPHHGWLGLLTLGMGFVTGHALPLVLGATAYAIGWIYVPDLPFFRHWVDRRRDQSVRAGEEAKVVEFKKRRDALLGSLAAERLDRYQALAAVCQNIEVASAESALGGNGFDPRLRKLDELMWTYLRLLSIEESLERFVETERLEGVPSLVHQAEGEVAHLGAEIESLKAQGGRSLENRERFLASRMERLEVLHKRLERSQQATDNLALVVAEEERLDQQIKLIRADAVASRNAGALTARIDATVEHLDETNRWLSEMDEFKDLVGDLPNTELRVGFSPSTMPPPIPQSRPSARGRIRQ
ncbi:MAG: hypothetical protein JWL90_3442 [Chthoniobacteraceae bacterium]|nr:hypothetical protein [Chthoniobacteraceae bacterium]